MRQQLFPLKSLLAYQFHIDSLVFPSRGLFLSSHSFQPNSSWIPLFSHVEGFSSLVILFNPIPQASEAGAIPMPANAIRQEAEMAHGEVV